MYMKAFRSVTRDGQRHYTLLSQCYTTIRRWHSKSQSRIRLGSQASSGANAFTAPGYSAAAAGKRYPSADGASSSSWPPQRFFMHSAGGRRGGAQAAHKSHLSDPLYEPFMGSSTRFRMPSTVSRVGNRTTTYAGTSPYMPPSHAPGGVATVDRSINTREVITALEKEKLGHSPPGRVNDHICIAMVKVLRWLADRAFRERYIHRATMLATIASAAPTAGMFVGYLRLFFNPGNALDRAPYARHPEDTKRGVQQGASDGESDSSTVIKQAKRFDSNCADELRGLFSQAEQHAVHYHLLLSMADIGVVERGFVLVMQAVHFCIFAFLFAVYPRMAFRLMAYMLEESGVVWTQMVNDIDLGKVNAAHPVSPLALTYWGLQDHFWVEGESKGDERSSSSSSASATTTCRESEENQNLSVDKVEAEKPQEETKNNAPAAAAATQEAANSQSIEKTTAETNDTFTAATCAAPSNMSRRLEAEADAEQLLTLRDVVLLIRSDEMVYRDINHRTADVLDQQSHYFTEVFESLVNKGKK